MTPWTVARQTPLSMGFSRQERCSGFACPSPGHFPKPGIEPMFLRCPASLPLAPPGMPKVILMKYRTKLTVPLQWLSSYPELFLKCLPWILDPGRPGLCLPLPTRPLHAPPFTHSPCLFALWPSQLYTAFFSPIFIWPRWVLVATCGIFSCGMWTPSCSRWDLVSWPGIGPLHWECGVTATRPPGRSLHCFHSLADGCSTPTATAAPHSADPGGFCPKACRAAL